MTLLALAIAPPALAQQADVAGEFSQLDEAARTFANTCLAHVFVHVDLHQKYDASATTFLYAPAQAAAFLDGHSGAVWGLRGSASHYALVLRDGGFCSLAAQTPVAGVWDDFDTMLKLFFPDSELVPVSAATAAPASGAVSSKSYRLRRDGALLPPLFTLTVSTDPKTAAARMTIWFPPSAPQP